nr:DNA recombination/repair protein RecA [Francisella tularensis]
MDVKKGISIIDGIDVSSNEIKFNFVISKVAPPFKHTDFELIYGDGISL